MAEQYKIIQLSIDDNRYPKHLRKIKRPPQSLYLIGNIDLLKEPGIAVVGTRRCTSYGRWAAYEIGREIASCGVTVVSGMAYGIDSRGHLGCLDAGGNTIAVLGTPIDRIYPKSNTELYKRIAEQGLIVSEYGPGEETGSWSFPERNRIISGLSSKVVVVEGHLKSGSMITAGLALEQNRDVFAVPGNINNMNAIGTNMLIRDGAIPITSIEEVPEILSIGVKRSFLKVLSSCSEDEQKILMYIKVDGGADIEKVALKLRMDIRNVSALVSALELKGHIYRDGDRLYLN